MPYLLKRNTQERPSDEVSLLPSNRSERPGTGAALVFMICMPLFMLFYSCYQLWRAEALNGSHCRTSATVQALPLTENSRDRYQVEYLYTVHGRSYQSNDSIPETYWRKLGVGQQVGIVYVEHYPGISRCVGDPAGKMSRMEWIAPIMFSLLMLAAFGHSLVTYLRRPRPL